MKAIIAVALLAMAWFATGAAQAETRRHARAAAVNEPPVLRAVRSARQPGHDRLVFEFGGKRLPRWDVRFVEPPVQDCGSGDTVPVAGRAWLQVRFTGAQAHSEQGRSTSGPRRRKLPLKIGRELVRSCDFEGEVTWVVGLNSRTTYKARTLGTPSRLVIDIAHRGAAPKN